MSGLNLYELSHMLTEAVDAAVERVDTETGELPADWASFIDAIEMERDQKILNCAALYKSWSAEAEAIRTEEKALAARRHAVEARGERIKGWMIQNMQAGEKLSDARCTLSWRTSPGSVLINNSALIPDEFYHKEIVWHKKELGDAIKGGATIPGAELVKSMNLTIK